MNTRKFEYLETIRKTVELGDYEELKDYVEVIRDAVREDPDFSEIFMELNRGHYRDVIPIIDDLIYKELQAEFERIENEDVQDKDDDDDIEEDLDLSEFSLEFDYDEDIQEDISFESLDEDGYFEKAEDDNY